MRRRWRPRLAEFSRIDHNLYYAGVGDVTRAREKKKVAQDFQSAGD